MLSMVSSKLVLWPAACFLSCFEAFGLWDLIGHTT